LAVLGVSIPPAELQAEEIIALSQLNDLRLNFSGMGIAKPFTKGEYPNANQ
jgi:hypothetical protein